MRVTSSRRAVRTALLLAGSTIAAPAMAGTITGEVVDATDTRALEAAQVRIVELDRVETASRDGSFRFENVPAGSYTLETRYIGAASDQRSITVPETGTVTVEVQLASLGGNNDIIVIGQAANQASSLSRKRENDGVSDVITRDSIGQFPDQNVAESLRRLPGINVLNDQGEGRFVSVRGLDPNLNSTSLNGVRLPSPEADTRAVALDVISSDIIESIEVKKSLTPDMEADTIGASVEIETTSAFDRKKDLLTVKLEGSYNDYADEVTPKASLDFATRLTDNIGVSGGISYYKRKFETDNIEADGHEEAGGIIFPTEVQYRDYDVTRERLSATLGFDFRASASTELFARGTYSQFDDQEYRRRTTFDLGDFDNGNFTVSGDKATFDSNDEDFTVERDVKDRFERQIIRSLSFGGETETGPWTFNYMASWAKSSEREDDSVDPAKFEREFDGGDDVTVVFDYGDERMPGFNVTSGGSLFYDPSEYELDEIELTHLSDSEDEEFALQFDVGHEFPLTSGTFTVQGGAKARWREKSYDKEVRFYEPDGVTYTLADVLGSQTYRIQDIGPVASYEGATDLLFDNPGDFELQQADSDYDSAIEDYVVGEDIKAGYLLGRYESSNLRVIGGVRYEHTSDDLNGNNVDYYEDGETLPGGAIALVDTVISNPVNIKKNYGHWLPSLVTRFEPRDNLVLRAGVYRSLVRPKLSDLAPNVALNDDDEAEFGNPDLDPTTAWNFDASAEWYMSSNGALSAAVFYKDLDNFIADVTFDGDGSFRGIDYQDEAEIPMNGDSAEIFGIELGFAQAFNFLPAPLDGLIVQANYTYTDSEGTITTLNDPGNPDAGARSIPLPSTAKHTANIVLGYEKGPVELRLAGTYRDRYLDELGEVAEEDRYVDDHFQLDLTAKYKVSDNIKLFYEWINLNNAKYYAYNNFGGQRNLLQYEEYNWTMKFGARVKF